MVSRPPTEDELVERARGGDAAAFAALVRASRGDRLPHRVPDHPQRRRRRGRRPGRADEGLARAAALPPRRARSVRGCSRSSRTRRATGGAAEGRREGSRCARRTSFPRGTRLRLPRGGLSRPRSARRAARGARAAERATTGSSSSCRYLLDLGEEETAEVLSLRRGTVKSRTSRALGRLPRELRGGGRVTALERELRALERRSTGRGGRRTCSRASPAGRRGTTEAGRAPAPCDSPSPSCSRRCSPCSPCPPPGRRCSTGWGSAAARIVRVDELPPVSRRQPGLGILGDRDARSMAPGARRLPVRGPPATSRRRIEIRVAPGPRRTYVWRDGVRVRLLMTQFPGSVTTLACSRSSWGQRRGSSSSTSTVIGRVARGRAPRRLLRRAGRQRSERPRVARRQHAAGRRRWRHGPVEERSAAPTRSTSPCDARSP